VLRCVCCLLSLGIGSGMCCSDDEEEDGSDEDEHRFILGMRRS
jgi:hypothetical protein